MDEILSTLACHLKTKPHNSSAAPIPLHDTEEIPEAAQNTDADKQYRAKHRGTEKLAK